MKKIIWFLPMLFLWSCTQEEVVNTDLYLYFDYTEGQNYEQVMAQDVDKYLQLMDISEHSRNYGTVKVYPLHDISASVNQTVKIKEGKSQLEGNRYVRQKEVNQFKEKLGGKLTSLNESFKNTPLNNSHIFAPICKGFKKLQQSDTNQKIVIIYSDMLENSNVANLHRGKVDYAELAATLDETCNCGDLMDIQLYVVHPVSKPHDQLIRQSAGLWQQYFQGKGLDSKNFHFDTSIDI